VLAVVICPLPSIGAESVGRETAVIDGRARRRAV
jgi:hypothetical protein